MGSHNTDPTHSHINTRLSPPIETSATILTSAPILVLHPSAAEVLERVEVEDVLDAETYVQTQAEKKYNHVKETGLQQLLNQAREELGTEQLDVVVIRRKTNLASAKGSRVKKDVKLELLGTQLTRKSRDAQILASEVRRLLGLLQQQGIATYLAKTQLHRQIVVNKRLCQRLSQIQNPALQNPTLQNPALQNPALQNPAFQNPLTDNTCASSSQRLSEEYDAGYRTSGLCEQAVFAVSEQLVGATCCGPVTDANKSPFWIDQGEAMHPPCTTVSGTIPEGDEGVDMHMRNHDDIDPTWKAADGAAQTVSPDIADPKALHTDNPSNHYTVAP